MNYNELLEKANIELAKVCKMLENEAFGSMNLKMHYASYYEYSDLAKDFPLCAKESDDLFYRWCENEYDCFIEWCSENNIDFDKMKNHIGRTSTFYLHKWYDKTIGYMIDNILTDLAPYYCGGYVYINDNGLIDNTDYEEYEDETIAELEYIANDFYNDFVYATEDILKVYDYIKYVKDNQIEVFKDWLGYVESDLEYEAEVQNQYEEDARNMCIEIKNTYGILEKDMKILKNVICYY